MFLEPKFNKDDLQVLLREVEARTRLIVNLTAIGEGSDKLIEVTQNKRKRANAKLILTLAKDAPLDNADLDFAGTVYLEGDKTAVVVYRERSGSDQPASEEQEADESGDEQTDTPEESDASDGEASSPSEGPTEETGGGPA